MINTISRTQEVYWKYTLINYMEIDKRNCCKNTAFVTKITCNIVTNRGLVNNGVEFPIFSGLNFPTPL
jgi:hypothetical protein